MIDFHGYIYVYIYLPIYLYICVCVCVCVCVFSWRGEYNYFVRFFEKKYVISCNNCMLYFLWISTCICMQEIIIILLALPRMEHVVSLTIVITNNSHLEKTLLERTCNCMHKNIFHCVNFLLCRIETSVISHCYRESFSVNHIRKISANAFRNALA